MKTIGDVFSMVVVLAVLVILFVLSGLCKDIVLICLFGGTSVVMIINIIVELIDHSIS